MIRNLRVFVMFVLTVCVPGLAAADTITLQGFLSGQYSTATTVAEFNSQTNTFTFTITNTSAITQPGSTSTITGIGFDLPPTGNASASGLNGFTGSQAPSLSSDFDFSDGALGSVPELAAVVLDFGFLTGGSSVFATGFVNDGLLAGESASFTVSGAAFAGLTEAQLANAIFLRFESVPTAAGVGAFDVSGVGLTATPVPEPSTIALLGLGLAGLAVRIRRRKNRQ